MERRTPLRQTDSLSRRSRLRPMSRKRRRQQRDRAAAIRDTYGDEPTCWWPGCQQPATDSHHLLPRGRGGQDGPANERPVCRHHHRMAHEHPQLAAEVGMLLSGHGRGGQA